MDVQQVVDPLTAEPVLVNSLVSAIVALLVAFCLHLALEQTATSGALVTAVLVFVARGKVTTISNLATAKACRLAISLRFRDQSRIRDALGASPSATPEAWQRLLPANLIVPKPRRRASSYVLDGIEQILKHDLVPHHRDCPGLCVDQS